MPTSRREFLRNALAALLGGSPASVEPHDSTQHTGCVVETAHDLRHRKVSPGFHSAAVQTLGCNLVDDGGGGLWRWNPMSNLNDELGTVLRPIGYQGVGRWERIHDAGCIDFTWFGGVADNTTDNSPVWERIETYRQQLCQGAVIKQNVTINIPPGKDRYLHKRPIVIDNIDITNKPGDRSWSGGVVCVADGATIHFRMPPGDRQTAIRILSYRDTGGERAPTFEMRGGRWIFSGPVEECVQVTDIGALLFRDVVFDHFAGIALNIRCRHKSSGVENVKIQDCQFPGKGAAVICEGPAVTGGKGAASFARFSMERCWLGGEPHDRITDPVAVKRHNRYWIGFFHADPYHGVIKEIVGNGGGFVSIIGFEGAYTDATVISDLGFETQAGGKPHRYGDRSGGATSDGTKIIVTDATPRANLADDRDEPLEVYGFRDIHARVSFIGGDRLGEDLHSWITQAHSTRRFVAERMPEDGWAGDCYIHGMYGVLFEGANANATTKIRDLNIIGATRWRTHGKAVHGSIYPPIDYRVAQQWVDGLWGFNPGMNFNAISAPLIGTYEVRTPHSIDWSEEFAIHGDECFVIPAWGDKYSNPPLRGHPFRSRLGMYEITVISGRADSNRAIMVSQFVLGKHTNRGAAGTVVRTLRQPDNTTRAELMIDWSSDYSAPVISIRNGDTAQIYQCYALIRQLAVPSKSDFGHRGWAAVEHETADRMIHKR